MSLATLGGGPAQGWSRLGGGDPSRGCGCASCGEDACEGEGPEAGPLEDTTWRPNGPAAGALARAVSPTRMWGRQRGGRSPNRVAQPAVYFPGGPAAVLSGWDPTYCSPTWSSNGWFSEIESITVDTPGEATARQFTSIAGCVNYTYTEERTGERRRANVIFRLNFPGGQPEWTDGEPIGLAFFVNGTAGVGVGCGVDSRWVTEATSADGADDFAASVLASGADMETVGGRPVSFGRTRNRAMMTLHINNPSYGGVCDAGGIGSQDIEFYVGVASPKVDGDDNCGPASRAAYEAVVDAVFGWLSGVRGIEEDNVRLLVVSFSNGLSCAAGWVAETSHDVHVLIDLEGPTSSTEILVATECYDPLDRYSFRSGGDLRFMPSHLGADAWRTCNTRSPCVTAVGSGGKFDPALNRYYRPPWRLGESLKATTPDVHPPLEGAPDHDPTVLDWAPSYWQEREAWGNLLSRRGAYVRINHSVDHVQPTHYEFRHALRALIQARAARGCPDGQDADDVFWVDLEYLERAVLAGDREVAAPKRFELGTADEDVWDEEAWPNWEDLVSFAGAKWAVQVDITRWAMEQTWSTGCS